MPQSSIVTESRAEILSLFGLIGKKGRVHDRPNALLIGGWAVYTYNPYYGSVDIDILTTSDMKRFLVTELKAEGFRYHKDAFEDRHLCKQASAGPIMVDFFNSTTRYAFEGRRECIRYDFLYEGWESSSVLGMPVPVPSRTALLVTKLKAGWDRCWRLENRKTTDPEHEARKLVKDYADILSLVDQEKGGRTLDLKTLGDMLDRFEFLGIVFESIPNSNPAAGLYGITQQEAKNKIDELKSLL